MRDKSSKLKAERKLLSRHSFQQKVQTKIVVLNGHKKRLKWFKIQQKLIVSLLRSSNNSLRIAISCGKKLVSFALYNLAVACITYMHIFLYRHNNSLHSNKCAKQMYCHEDSC